MTSQSLLGFDDATRAPALFGGLVSSAARETKIPRAHIGAGRAVIGRAAKR
jgi:hypothetical protein